jgi:hypothetical protein
MHKMSPGRNIDVYKSKIQNNAIHNSFQRAVTAHGTDFIQATTNFAYWIQGHAFMIENGDEDLTE